MAQELEQGVIRILDRGGRTIGTGFIVDNCLAATCAHVAVAALGDDPADRVIWIQFYAAPGQHAAELLPCETGADDVAFIRLPAMPAGAGPLRLWHAGRPDGHAYETLGYPAQAGPGAAQKTNDTVNGIVEAAHENREPLLLLKGNEITHGMSGSPVLDKVTDRVIGMISEHKRQEYANLIYATTIDTLLRYWPELKLDPPVEEPGPDFIKVLEERVAAYVQNLRRQAGEPVNLAAGPYPGLEYYQMTDAGRFFGRARAIDDLSSRLGSSRLSVLHADSGAGKTSLLLAGIAPRLVQSGHIPVYVRPYDRYPTLAIKQAILSEDHQHPAVRDASLRGFLQQVCKLLGNADVYILLDQFEEFFTLQSGPAQKQFAAELAECMEDAGLPVGWVLSLRKEHFSDLSVFSPPLNPFSNEYRLALLSSSEAGQAIIEPANLYGIHFDDGLVERILADLQQLSAEDHKTGAASETVRLSPPQLQLVCQALLDTLEHGEEPPVPGRERQVTLAGYEASGKAAGILRNHLKRVLHNNLPAVQRPAALRLLEALVSSKGQRLVRTPAQLAEELATANIPADNLPAILASLVKGRILRPLDGEDLLAVPGAGQEAIAYELVHDYLAEQVTLSPEARERKNAQELLEREVASWQSYGALLRPETLLAITAQRLQLRIPPGAGPLLARSAFETGIDLPGWLACFPPETGRRVLLDGLLSPQTALRLRALLHLSPYIDEETVERAVQRVEEEDDAGVRQAAIELLHQHVPRRLREALLADLAGSSPAWRQAQSAGCLQDFLDAETAAALFKAVATNADPAVWMAALRVLAGPGAAPYRRDWRPLQPAVPERLVETARAMRGLGIRLPFWLAAKTFLAQVVLLWRDRRARKTMLRSAALIAPAVIYLALAGFFNLPPQRRLLQVPGVPTESLRYLAGPVRLADQAGQIYYVSSYNYGIAVYNGNAWSSFITAGLPQSERPADPNRPESNIQAIDAIALDPNFPERAYVLTRESGVYFSQDRGQTWQVLFNGQQDQPGLKQAFGSVSKELAANDKILLLAASQHGLYLHVYGTPTWEKVSGRDGLPDGDFRLVRFSPQGSPVAAGPDGLYQASAAYPPWTWTKIEGVGPVSRLAFGQDGRLFLALGIRGEETACLVDGRLVEESRLNFESGFNVVTAIAGSPTTANKDTYYAGTQLGQVVECTCQGQRRSISWFLPGQSITGLIYWQDFLSDSLILLNRQGLYQLNVEE